MKINQPSACLDHMIRQSRQHHVQLSAMADLKANMLLTVSAVMLSLSVPHLRTEHFRWPALVLIGFCLLTIGLAAYAAMPKLSFRPAKPRPVNPGDPAFNLLFFGDFVRMTYPDFEQAMEEVLNEPSRVYEVQVRELYLLGRFLGLQKYRFLKLAYLSFITGFLASAAVLVATGGLH